MTLGIVYNNGANISTITYAFSTGADGTITFTDMATSTSNYVKTLADNLLPYFFYSGTARNIGATANGPVTVQPSGNKFRLGWIPNNNGQTGILFGLYLVSDPHSYIPGVLSKF
jgi:hypothetical protein